MSGVRARRASRGTCRSTACALGAAAGLVLVLVSAPAEHGGGRAGSLVEVVPLSNPSPTAQGPAGRALAPAVDIVEAQPIAATAVRSTVGQLLSRAGQQTRQCTATVVASRSKSVAVTAAHCVYTPAEIPGVPPPPAGDQGWVDETQFVPGADGEEQPFGVWEVEKILIDPRWQTEGDPVHDVAFLRLAPRDGATAQDVLGAQGIGLAPTQPVGPLSAVGYPGAGRFSGDQAVRCLDEQPGVDAQLGGDFTIGCDMTEGSSGGPWVDELDEDTGLGVVVAVTSLRVLGNDQIAGARLADDVMELFRAIDEDAASQAE